MSDYAVVNQNNLRVLLPSKVALTLEEISRVRNTRPEDELERFYASGVYGKLEDESTKYWCFSPAELCELYLDRT